MIRLSGGRGKERGARGQYTLVPGQPGGWGPDADIEGVALASFVGEDVDDQAGWALSSGGDANGDGLDDLLIGVWNHADGGLEAGRAYLVFGRAAGWSMATGLGDADVALLSEAPGARTGYSVALDGDVDGDGLDDLWIGAPQAPGGGEEDGCAYLVLGREQGWEPEMDLAQANAILEGAEDDWLGFAVAHGGDADGDGCGDLWAGAPRREGDLLGHDGVAHLVLGFDCVDADGDGVDACHGDCDDADAAVYWGAPDDPCDGRDTDCDGVLDEFGDLDGDGVSVCDGDCNDGDPAAFPGATETCDDQDTDCDGAIPASCNRYNTLGSFDVSQRDLWLYVKGRYLSDPYPDTAYKVAEEGACAFFQLEPPPFCDPPCEWPLECGFGDVCRPHPALLDVGEVVVLGVGSPITLPFTQYGDYAWDGSGAGFQPGLQVEVDVEGGSGVGPFRLCATAPPELALPEETLELRAGQDGTFGWIPAADARGAHLHLWLIVHDHAYSGAYVECAAEDGDGSLVIPADIVDRFQVANVNSWGSDAFYVTVSRRNRVATETDLGCAELVVRSRRHFDGTFVVDGDD